MRRAAFHLKSREMVTGATRWCRHRRARRHEQRRAAVFFSVKSKPKALRLLRKSNPPTTSRATFAAVYSGHSGRLSRLFGCSPSLCVLRYLLP